MLESPGMLYPTSYMTPFAFALRGESSRDLLPPSSSSLFFQQRCAGTFRKAHHLFLLFHKSRESFSLSFAEYNYILFRLNPWDANKKIRPNCWDVVTYKYKSQTRKCYTKKLQTRRFLCGIWIETPPPPDCDRDSNSGVSLRIVTASWAPERKPRPLYESNNQNNFSLERSRKKKKKRLPIIYSSRVWWYFMTREKLSRSSLLCCIIYLSKWLSRWCSRFLPLYIFKKSRRLRDGRSPIQSTTIREKVSTRKMFSFWLTTTFLEINLKLIKEK